MVLRKKRLKTVEVKPEELEKKKRELKRKGKGPYLQIVHRRKPHSKEYEEPFLRIPPHTIDNPTFAQMVWRYIFGEASYSLYGTMGTKKLRDGRRVQRNALKLPSQLKKITRDLGWDLQRIRWYGLMERRARKATQWLLRFQAYLKKQGHPAAELPLKELAKKCETTIKTARLRR